MEILLFFEGSDPLINAHLKHLIALFSIQYERIGTSEY